MSNWLALSVPRKKRLPKLRNKQALSVYSYINKWRSSMLSATYYNMLGVSVYFGPNGVMSQMVTGIVASI